MENKIVFGNRVKDLVSGFEGIVTGEVTYMNGCQKWAIDGAYNKEKQHTEGVWTDKQQVVKIDDGIADQIAPPKPGGGPMRTPPRG